MLNRVAAIGKGTSPSLNIIDVKNNLLRIPNHARRIEQCEDILARQSLDDDQKSKIYAVMCMSAWQLAQGRRMAQAKVDDLSLANRFLIKGLNLCKQKETYEELKDYQIRVKSALDDMFNEAVATITFGWRVKKEEKIKEWRSHVFTLPVPEQIQAYEKQLEMETARVGKSEPSVRCLYVDLALINYFYARLHDERAEGAVCLDHLISSGAAFQEAFPFVLSRGSVDTRRWIRHIDEGIRKLMPAFPAVSYEEVSGLSAPELTAAQLLKLINDENRL